MGSSRDARCWGGGSFSANEKTEIETSMPNPLKCQADGGCIQVPREWVETGDFLGADGYDYILDEVSVFKGLMVESL